MSSTRPPSFQEMILRLHAFWAAQVFSLIPDTTAPTQTLSVNEATNPGGQFFNSTTNCLAMIAPLRGGCASHPSGRRLPRATCTL